MTATRRSSRLQAQKPAESKEQHSEKKRKLKEDDSQKSKKKPKPKASRAKDRAPKKDPGSSNAGDFDNFDFTSFVVRGDGKDIACERRAPSTNAQKPCLVFTHGAGGGLAAPAAKEFAEGFGSISSVISFEGSMNLKARVKGFHAVLAEEAIGKALGGRSMGARAAVVASQESGSKVNVLILVSYPLRGGAKGDMRDQILLDLSEDVDVLFISGDKDSICDVEELNEVRGKMLAKSWLIVVAGADHGMSLTPKRAVKNIRRESGRLAAFWMSTRDKAKRYRRLAYNAEANEVCANEWMENPER